VCVRTTDAADLVAVDRFQVQPRDSVTLARSFKVRRSNVPCTKSAAAPSASSNLQFDPTR
jgi:hypothetical protein